MGRLTNQHVRLLRASLRAEVKSNVHQLHDLGANLTRLPTVVPASQRPPPDLFLSLYLVSAWLLPIL